jgi:hypothetical protein
MLRDADVEGWSDGRIIQGQASMEVDVSCSLRKWSTQGDDDGGIALRGCAIG